MLWNKNRFKFEVSSRSIETEAVFTKTNEQ